MEEIKIIKRSTEIFNRQTGFNIEFQIREDVKDSADYIVKIKTPNNRRKLSYIAKTKKKSDAAIGDIAIKLKRNSEQTIIIAEYISPSQIEKLRNLDVEFLDTAGNAYINNSGTFIFIFGNKLKKLRKIILDIMKDAKDGGKYKKFAGVIYQDGLDDMENYNEILNVLKQLQTGIKESNFKAS